MSHPGTSDASIPTPDDSIMKRLGYIRLLYQQAMTQSYAPAPLNFSAVLMFHDLMEYFFIVAVAHLGGEGIDLDVPFSKNAKKLQAPDGNRLFNLDVVRRVGDYRNGFKHRGSIPGIDQVEETRRDASLFLESNCPRFFGVEFSDISMLHIVPQEPVRDHLKTGRAAADESDITKGMGELALAFDRLILDWSHGKYLPNSTFRTERFELDESYRGRRRRIEIRTPRSSEVRTPPWRCRGGSGCCAAHRSDGGCRRNRGHRSSPLSVTSRHRRSTVADDTA